MTARGKLPVPVPYCSGGLAVILTGWQLLFCLPHVVSSWGDEWMPSEVPAQVAPGFHRGQGCAGPEGGLPERMEDLRRGGSQVLVASQ